MTRRFVAQAPAKWEEYRAWAADLDGTVHVVYHKDKDRVVDSYFEFRHNRRCRMYQEQRSLPARKNGQLYANNPTYAFELNRKGSDQPWVVAGLELHREGRESEIEKQTVTGLTLLRWPVRVSSVDLTDLVRQPTFRVVRAATVQRDGREFVEVEFDNKHPPLEKDKEFFPVQSGVLLLDPHRSWYVRSYTVHEEYGDGSTATAKGESQLDEALGEYPVPKRVSYAAEIDHPKLGRVIKAAVSDYQLHRPESLPQDEDFYLAAFGLPEPYDVTPSRPRWYLWLGGTAIGCLVVGVFLHRLTRRA